MADDIYDPPPDCICASGASDRDCLIAVIDFWMGAAGQYTSIQNLIPGWQSVNGSTSCGDVLGNLLIRWGGAGRYAFMVDDPIKVDGAGMPQAGDIFVLNSVATGSRHHVGFFYEVSGTPDSFQWRPAEGGQGALDNQLMWISDKWRGVNDGDTVLDGWKSLGDITRDRLVCKRFHKP